MATHKIVHPTKGACTIDVGRYLTFQLHFSKVSGKEIPKTYLKKEWPSVELELLAEGAKVTQIAWTTPVVVIQKKGKVWHISCEATFNGVTIQHSAKNKDEEVAKKAFWFTWTENRRAAHEPTHLAILEDKRYKYLVPVDG